MSIPALYYSHDISIINSSHHDFFYLTRILRVKTGDKIAILIGDGKRIDKKIISIDSKKIVLETILVIQKNLPDKKIILNMSLISSVKFDMVVEKATELGVSIIQPLVAQRSQIRNIDVNKKLARWHRIAEAAFKQSHAVFFPVINLPMNLQQLQKLSFFQQGFSYIFSLSNNSYVMPDKKQLSQFEFINLFIGPEGGFTLSELEIMKSYHHVETRLSQNILRAETAAIASLSIVQFFLNQIIHR